MCHLVLSCVLFIVIIVRTLVFLAHTVLPLLQQLCEGTIRTGFNYSVTCPRAMCHNVATPPKITLLFPKNLPPYEFNSN